MRESVEAAIACNRFGFGARPGDLTDVGREPRAWLGAQLRGAPPQVAAGLRGSAEGLAEVIELRRASRAGRENPEGAAAVKLAVKLGQVYRPVYVAEATARLATAVDSDRPFLERLTHFWTNHFAVSVDKLVVLGLAGAFEREAIRPHVLGSFTDLLLAVEQHPAMLLYLDNHLSVGPNSPLGERVARRRSDVHIGINENLAREILELHTLGVDGGYTQADVTSFAYVISGWSIGGDSGRLRGGVPGRFLFRPELHEPGAKVVLGKRYAEAGFEQGASVLTDLARHPSTAHHIAVKLARHFIADEPAPATVDHLARVFRDTEGDLPSLYQALIDSPEPWAQPLTKFKAPSEFLISAYRGLKVPVIAGQGGLASLEVLGQRTYAPGSPAGWPDRSADWSGASALLKRVEWADAVGQRLGDQRAAAELAPQMLGATLSSATRTAIAHAASAPQALTLLIAAPEFLRR